MNSKLLIFMSILTAFLCHLAFFSFCTFVFPIDPPPHKPKFFFLGSILEKNDVKKIQARNDHSQDHAFQRSFSSSLKGLNNTNYKTADQTKNPFAIQTIKKPLIPQTGPSRDKLVIKSIFSIQTENETVQETEQPNLDLKLNIRPYRPLQFRAP